MSVDHTNASLFPPGGGYPPAEAESPESTQDPGAADAQGDDLQVFVNGEPLEVNPDDSNNASGGQSDNPDGEEDVFVTQSTGLFGTDGMTTADDDGTTVDFATLEATTTAAGADESVDSGTESDPTNHALNIAHQLHGSDEMPADVTPSDSTVAPTGTDAASGTPGVDDAIPNAVPGLATHDDSAQIGDVRDPATPAEIADFVQTHVLGQGDDPAAAAEALVEALKHESSLGLLSDEQIADLAGHLFADGAIDTAAAILQHAAEQLPRADQELIAKAVAGALAGQPGSEVAGLMRDLLGDSANPIPLAKLIARSDDETVMRIAAEQLLSAADTSSGNRSTRQLAAAFELAARKPAVAMELLRRGHLTPERFAELAPDALAASENLAGLAGENTLANLLDALNAYQSEAEVILPNEEGTGVVRRSDLDALDLSQLDETYAQLQAVAGDDSELADALQTFELQNLYRSPAIHERFVERLTDGETPAAERAQLLAEAIASDPPYLTPDEAAGLAADVLKGGSAGDVTSAVELLSHMGAFTQAELAASNLTRSDQDAFAQAIGQAFDQNLLEGSDIGGLIAAAHGVNAAATQLGETPPIDSMALANLVGRSESLTLQNTTTDLLLDAWQTLETGEAHGIWQPGQLDETAVMPALFAAARVGASSPETAQHLLDRLGDPATIRDFASTVTPAMADTTTFFGRDDLAANSGRSALGDLIEMVAQRPASAASDALVMEAMGQADTMNLRDQPLRDGINGYLEQHGNRLLRQLGQLARNNVTPDAAERFTYNRALTYAREWASGAMDENNPINEFLQRLESDLFLANEVNYNEDGAVDGAIQLLSVLTGESLLGELSASQYDHFVSELLRTAEGSTAEVLATLTHQFTDESVDLVAKALSDGYAVLTFEDPKSAQGALDHLMASADGVLPALPATDGENTADGASGDAAPADDAPTLPSAAVLLAELVAQAPEASFQYAALNSLLDQTQAQGSTAGQDFFVATTHLAASDPTMAMDLLRSGAVDDAFVQTIAPPAPEATEGAEHATMDDEEQEAEAFVLGDRALADLLGAIQTFQSGSESIVTAASGEPQRQTTLDRADYSHLDGFYAASRAAAETSQDAALTIAVEALAIQNLYRGGQPEQDVIDQLLNGDAGLHERAGNLAGLLMAEPPLLLEPEAAAFMGTLVQGGAETQVPEAAQLLSALGYFTDGELAAVGLNRDQQSAVADTLGDAWDGQHFDHANLIDLLGPANYVTTNIGPGLLNTSNLIKQSDSVDLTSTTVDALYDAMRSVETGRDIGGWDASNLDDPGLGSSYLFAAAHATSSAFGWATSALVNMARQATNNLLPSLIFEEDGAVEEEAAPEGALRFDTAFSLFGRVVARMSVAEAGEEANELVLDALRNFDDKALEHDILGQGLGLYLEAHGDALIGQLRDERGQAQDREAIATIDADLARVDEAIARFVPADGASATAGTDDASRREAS